MQEIFCPKLGDPFRGLSLFHGGTIQYCYSTFNDLGKMNLFKDNLPSTSTSALKTPAKPDENGVPSQDGFLESTLENQLVGCLEKKGYLWGLAFEILPSAPLERRPFLGALVSSETTVLYTPSPQGNLYKNHPKKTVRQASFRTASTELAALCHMNDEGEFLVCCSLSCEAVGSGVRYPGTCLLVLVVYQARAKENSFLSRQHG